MMKDKKLLLIGWDAADWHVIMPLVEQGKMPTLKRLMENGSSGNLATLNPPLSPMLWTSIATGKRAYQHGIHGFAEINPNNGEIEPIKATSRKVKTFWNILNEANLKTNVINWWPSHPAEQIKGVSVSNFYHSKAPVYGEDWPLDKSTVYPPDLYEDLKDLRLHPGELTLSHIWPFVPNAHKLDPEDDKVLKPLMRVLAHCSSIHNAATHVMENTEWDVTAVYYEAIDHFSHLAMKYHPPKQEGIDDEEFELYKGIVEAAYRFHDMMLDRLLSLAGEECHVLLVSDHGFQSGDLRVVELPDVSAAPALEHRKYGVVLAKGPAFKPNHKIYGSSLLDITPTILHLFDLPVGEDMEGKVINDLWKEKGEEGWIPSWEITEKRPPFNSEGETQMNEEILEQLEELGYLDLPKNEKQHHIDKELEYNLIQSWIDGNKLKEARDLAEKYFDKHKDHRSAEILAHILLQSGEYDALDQFFEKIVDLKHRPALVFIYAMKLLNTGRAVEAMTFFKEMEEKGTVSVQLYNELGKALLIGGSFKDAQSYFNKTLKLDAANASALTGISHCYVEMGNYEKAIGFLDNSLSLTFYQPNAHYLMGLSLYHTDHEAEAKKALMLTLKQAPKHHKATLLLQNIMGEKNNASEPVIVVTGMPRSGTSMLMQFLDRGGVEIVSDAKREEDVHNPKGYFEYEKVKQLGADNTWVKEAKGKVIKVVSPLLRYLPSEVSYKVIWIKRPLSEVIVSQEVMKGKKKSDIMKNFPFKMALNLQEEEERLNNWIPAQVNMQHIEIEYYEFLNEPEKILGEINKFLNTSIKTDALDAIDKALHRNKLGE